MTTLADMTPEQRAQSVGMWCDCRDGSTVSRGVIYRIPLNEGHGSVDVLRVPPVDRGNPVVPGRYFDEITPLPDLPRAWTPTGEPVKCEWEDGIANVTHEGTTFFDQWGNEVDTEINHITDGNEYQDGQTVARRFITQWEEV